MYIPDLFGAYVKGRELAIAKNWEDLANYEKIEDARNDNDLKAMDIWERRQQMPGKMNMFNNNVEISELNTQVAREAHPGLVANARTGSLHAQDNHAIFLNNRDYGRTVGNDLYRANLGMIGAAAQNKQGQADYWLTNNRGYDAGGKTGQIAYDTLRGNSITASNYPTVAEQKIREGNAAHGLNMGNYAYQTDYIRGRHKQLPNELELQSLNTDNAIHTAKEFIPNQEASKKAQRDQQLLGLFQEHSALYDKLSTVTDPATRQVLQSQIAHLQDYMRSMGYALDMTIPSGADVSSQTTQGTTSNSGATGPAATQTGYPQGMTPNGMPVDLFNQMGNTVGGGSSRLTTPAQGMPTIVPPNANPNSLMNLANTVGSSYLPAWQVVP